VKFFIHLKLVSRIKNWKWCAFAVFLTVLFGVSFVGQWGLKLGKMILDAEQVPIAIFNGAKAGRPINFFLKNATEDQPITKNNYNRLFIRLNETGLKDHVRALFWSQGGGLGAFY